MKEDFKYRIIISIILGVFVVFVGMFNKIYTEQLEVNDSLRRVLNSQSTEYQYLIEEWNNDYEDLQSKYAEMIVENSNLKSQLDGEVVLPYYTFTEDEIYLLAQCVEAEAGFYEDYEISQKYITQVILNRLHSSKFPNSIEDIIYQKVNGVQQFCVAYNGRIDREVETETLLNVYSVIVSGTDLPEYVCYFYADYVEDNWVNDLNTYCTVGGTVFAYVDKEDY